MTIGYGFSGSGTTSSGTSHNFTIPGSPAVGGLVVINMFTATSGVTVTGDVQFTKWQTGAYTTTSFTATKYCYVVYKVLDSTDVGNGYVSGTSSATCTFSYSITMFSSSVGFGEYPIRGMTRSIESPNTTDHNIPTCWNDSHTGMTLLMSTQNGSTTTFSTPPTGLTERLDSGNFAIWTTATGVNGFVGSDSGGSGPFLTSSGLEYSVIWSILIREPWSPGGTAVLRPVGTATSSNNTDTSPYEYGGSVWSEQTGFGTWARDVDYLQGVDRTSASTGDRAIGAAPDLNNHPNTATLGTYRLDYPPDDIDTGTGAITAHQIQWDSVLFSHSDDAMVLMQSLTNSSSVVIGYGSSSLIQQVMHYYDTTDWTNTDSSSDFTDQAADSGPGVAPQYGMTDTWANNSFATQTLTNINDMKVQFRFGHDRNMAGDSPSILIPSWALQITYDLAPQNYTESVTDAVGITDGASRVHDAVRTVTDAVGITDSAVDYWLVGKTDVPKRLATAATAKTITVALAQDQWGKYLVPQIPWVNPVPRGRPSTLPTGIGWDAAFSPDGRFLVIGHNTTPFITIYEREGTTFTKLANPGTLPTGGGNNVVWSPDGRFLAVAHINSPYVTIYERSGSTFTKLTNPGTLPASTARGVGFSPDGRFLAIAHTTTPFVTIYEREDTTFTKLANPGTLPPDTGRGCAWSPDGRFLAIAHDTSPYITIYERSGTTFTKLTDPGTLPAGAGYDCAFSPDGRFLAVAHQTSPFITIYERSGTTFTKLTNPSTLPTSGGWCPAWSPDGRYLAVAHAISPCVTIYERSGTTFTKLPDSRILPTAIGVGAGWSPDGRFLAIAHNNSPYVTIYETSGLNPREGYLWMMPPGER